MATRLMREIRFSLTPESRPLRADSNTWAGWPSSDALCPHLTLGAVLRGSVDPVTGYVCNIKAIDVLLRSRAVSHLRRAWIEADRTMNVAGEMVALWPVVAPHCPRGTTLDVLMLHTTPHLSFSITRGEPEMVSLTYAFEFCAAHRLYCTALSDEENRRIFGRCTNPNGHGHNYVVQVTLRGTPDPDSGTLFALPELERVVHERVINVFDHKHLNKDVPEFASLNPSVENIARVIHEKLAGAFAPVRLERVRVYETPKTYAEYTTG